MLCPPDERINGALRLMLSESSRSFQPCSVAGPLPSRPTQATPPTAVLTAWSRWISQRFVPLNRSQWRYFLKRCYQEGKSKALIARYVGTRTGLQTERSYTARILPRGILKGLRGYFPPCGHFWSRARWSYHRRTRDNCRGLSRAQAPHEQDKHDQSRQRYHCGSGRREGRRHRR